MIPKIIHYCWLSGDPIPSELQKCMDSWPKVLPDYELKLWNFDIFDKNSSDWVREAYDAQKYAFAADYIRLYALYNYGGIYLDMDVEVIKSFNTFLNQREIICFEDSGYPEMATIACEKKCQWLEPCLKYYEKRHFRKNDGTFDTRPLPVIVRNVLCDNGYMLKRIESPSQYKLSSNLKEINVFPNDFFSPKSYSTGKMKITSNTVSIHHFAGTWVPWYENFENRIWRFLGKRNKFILTKVIKVLKRMLNNNG